MFIWSLVSHQPLIRVSRVLANTETWNSGGISAQVPRSTFISKEKGHWWQINCGKIHLLNSTPVKILWYLHFVNLIRCCMAAMAWITSWPSGRMKCWHNLSVSPPARPSGCDREASIRSFPHSVSCFISPAIWFDVHDQQPPFVAVRVRAWNTLNEYRHMGGIIATALPVLAVAPLYPSRLKLSKRDMKQQSYHGGTRGRG